MEKQVIVQQSDCNPKIDFYMHALELMNNSGIPYLIGGAYALRHMTGIYRDTKDLDIFIRNEDSTRTLELFASAGFDTSIAFPHWLAKAECEGHLVDIIFNSGNAIAEVDDLWFEYSEEGKIFGISVSYIPAEEMIWSKAFIQERERFDGADVNHVLLARGGRLNWQRLLDRFGPHWRVLLSHLITFGLVYPSERTLIPGWVMLELASRLEKEVGINEGERVCRGTLLSRAQYKIDIEERGFQDARLVPNGKLTKKQILKWDEGASVDGLYKRNRREPSIHPDA